MSHLVDLMPRACRERLGQRSRVRRWVAAYGACIGLIVIAASSARVVERTRQREVEGLRERVQLDAGQRRQAEQIEARIGSLQRDLDRQDRLSLPIPAGSLIDTVAQVMPESVSLNSLTLMPRQDRGAGKARASSAGRNGGAMPAAGRLLIEVRGVAPDDLQMSAFFDGLESHPLFTAIAVDFARKTQVRTVDAREFGLTCDIDLCDRFVMGSEGEEGEAP